METILMSKSERKRLAVMAQMTSGKLNLSGASELLGLSYRQTKRVLSRYRAEGDRGLVHGLRGKRSNRPSDAVLKEQSLARYVAAGGRLVDAQASAKAASQAAIATRINWRIGANGWLTS
jgi:hypothetical protein